MEWVLLLLKDDKMCKINKKSGDTRIDSCMIKLVELFNQTNIIKVLACCCGHNKYNMTIVVKQDNLIFELLSNKEIPRIKRFYKRDKQGYYFIPECV